MEKWDELRTAYWVARLGTVSAAAEHLGVHRATVARHIDSLEASLGGKLFQRHARGYEPTEAGLDLVRVARAASEQFQQLAGRTRGRSSEVSGELIVTTIELLTPLILPALAAFRVAHPDCSVRVEASGRVYKLEYGEAHVAVRAGSRPDHPDNVVQPFLVLRSGLYAHASYVARHGAPTSIASYADHTFVSDGAPDSSASFARWLRAHAPDAPVVFSSANGRINAQAVAAGLGIGFMPARFAEAAPDMVEIHAPLPEWDVPFWLVTHVDLHRTPKVQAVLEHLRAVGDAAEGSTTGLVG